MSFMTERYFQILENHKLYSLVAGEAALRSFVEHHALCVWVYRYLLRDIHQDLVKQIQPLATQSQKEALRLIAEIVLEEEVEEQSDGSLISHLEIYLEAMQDLGANMEATVGFFDLLDAGVDWRVAIQQAGFPEASVTYARRILSCLGRPLHERAAVLFYEGEPYIPDSFLALLGNPRQAPQAYRLLEYFERHIEGVKRPGFSSAGRLVELFCGDDLDMNDEAEGIAEEAMKARIDLWNAIAEQLEDKVDLNPPRPILRLVPAASF